jgi:hypothetical protein
MARAGYGALTEGRRYSIDTINLNAGWDLALTVHPDGEIGRYWYSDGTVDVPEEERSLVGSDAEIAIAVADFECREPLDYFTVHREVQLELEQRYIDQNRASFDALMTFYDHYKSGDHN